MLEIAAMYAIISYGEIIGHSELEHGDPPMGVAFGCFIPTARFDAFVQTVPPNMIEGDEVLIWNELSARTHTGLVLECAGIAVFLHYLGDRIAREVEVLGIPSSSYEDLFPQHVEVHNRGFCPPGE